MGEAMGLALVAGVVVVILLQAALLLRGRPDDAGRLQALAEAQERGLARLERELREEMARGRREDAEESFRDREERAQSSTRLAQALGTQVGQLGSLQGERLEAFARELNRFSQGLDERFERLKTAVEGRLTAIQADNAAKLDEMRRTVDEKLHATLEQRLGESFRLVSERLEQVHRGLGEMQTLAAGVGDLKRVLTNVKTRGTWGEVQLAALLEQLLTAGQFAANVPTRPGSAERVDFAIRLPGRDDGAEVWLPIDAKFPVEDYQRLLDASEPAAAEEAAKAIETRLKSEARSIRDKYVEPPHTTDFAILYLPVEGLYAEALRRPGLAESLQRDFRVSLAGPTTLAAMLNSLQMGFRTLAIEQRSAEVWAVLGAVKTEFGKFGEALAHTRKKLDEASNSIARAETRTRQLSRRLKDVEALPAGDADRLIGTADFDGEDA
ncbi:MAG: DNA recombination protein RmuC [Dechloromonas sp.]|jgi:DNA recombination protein RmuC|uniref:DNA recombination protein RmuC n=1 Tax=Azonexus sp. TaxID=1872668 RepID=UPI0035B384E7|nr:DNA recombination protein RmuC [Dechloromonas sp.]